MPRGNCKTCPRKLRRVDVSRVERWSGPADLPRYAAARMPRIVHAYPSMRTSRKPFLPRGQLPALHSAHHQALHGGHEERKNDCVFGRGSCGRPCGSPWSAETTAASRSATRFLPEGGGCTLPCTKPKAAGTLAVNLATIPAQTQSALQRSVLV